MRHDILSDVFNTIKIAERNGKGECVVPFSNLVKNILLVMQKNGYIGRFEFIDDGRGGKFRIELLQKINDARAIRPRFYVKVGDFIKWEKRFLPAVNRGILLLTTPRGVMTNIDAKKLNTGGQLLGYVY